VDVDAWLRERKEREAARSSARWARVHQDARFIERLERGQEARNAALAAEEERRRAAEAAAAHWQSVPFQPLSAPPAAAADAASEEERLLRIDAGRIFGLASVTPPYATLRRAAKEASAEAAPAAGAAADAATPSAPEARQSVAAEPAAGESH